MGFLYITYDLEQPITHFDIKPENILYKKDNHTNEILLKLADFGLA